MSQSRFHGWKARLFHLSHSPVFLAKVTGGILLGGFLVACAVVALRGNDTTNPNELVRRRYQAQLDELVHQSGPHERKLVDWLYKVTRPAAPEKPESRSRSKIPNSLMTFFGGSPPWNSFNLADIITRHVSDAKTRPLFEDYVEARIHGSSPSGLEARKHIEMQARSKVPPPFANEFLGDLLHDEGNSAAAYEAFLLEGQLPDAARARRLAVHLAVKLKNTSNLRTIVAMHSFATDAWADDLSRAAVLLGDWKLSAISFLRMEIERVRLVELVFTLLCGLLWYSVFIRFDAAERWQWLRPGLAVLAGIISIWPTMVLIDWQELVSGLHSSGGFVDDLVYYVKGVGLREETAKLVLFAPFLPWLLRRRSPTTALLTGAFVGLGFALEENLGYFERSGVGTEAVGRLLTANFFHAASTGLTGFALYELARTRFGKAEQFVATFVAIVVVHGLYDWVLTSGNSVEALGNISMFAIVILALLARHFFETLETHSRPKRGAVSLLSQFLVGVSVLITAAFIGAALTAGTLASLSDVGMSAIGVVPIAVFYCRKFVHF